jgi:hypothetical protein
VPVGLSRTGLLSKRVCLWCVLSGKVFEERRRVTRDSNFGILELNSKADAFYSLMILLIILTSLTSKV